MKRHQVKLHDVESPFDEVSLNVPTLLTMNRLENPNFDGQKVVAAALSLIATNATQDLSSFLKANLLTRNPVLLFNGPIFVDDIVVNERLEKCSLGFFETHIQLYSVLSIAQCKEQIGMTVGPRR